MAKRTNYLGQDIDDPRFAQQPTAAPVAGNDMLAAFMQALIKSQGAQDQLAGDKLDLRRDQSFGRHLGAGTTATNPSGLTPDSVWNSTFNTGGRGRTPGVNNPGTNFSWETPWTTPAAPAPEMMQAPATPGAEFDIFNPPLPAGPTGVPQVNPEELLLKYMMQARPGGMQSMRRQKAGGF